MREIVEKIINEKLNGSHLFLVNAEIKKNRIDIFIDGDCGVNINECAQLNRHLHNQLEEQKIDTSDIMVEISSPGFDRNLDDIRSFKKNVGRKIQIRNSQNKYIKGQLAVVNHKGIVLITGPAKGKKEITDYSEIKEAKVVI